MSKKGDRETVYEKKILKRSCGRDCNVSSKQQNLAEEMYWFSKGFIP